MRREELLNTYKRHYNPTLGRLFDVAACPVESWAEGMRLFDERGVAYLDFAAGYGVFGIGHLNSRVQAEVQRQLARLPMTPPLLYNEAAARLMHKLAKLLPAALNRIFLASSGSEAIEIALRTAIWARPARTRLIAATNSYHGKTLGALGVMGQPHLRKLFEPLWREIQFVPFGDAAAMARAIGGGALAVFLEPILGGGHLTVPPDGYLAAVRESCTRTNTPLVIDEVQTGFGRTGTMFAIDREHIIPDILILSKGITGGHTSIAAAVMRDELARSVGHAYEADPNAAQQAAWSAPLVCAAASAAIDIIVEEDLPARAARHGAYLIARLRRTAEAYPTLVYDVPGRGLMTGVKLRNNIVESAVWMQLLKRKLLSGLSTNNHTAHPVLRFFPPLTVTRAEIDIATEAFHDAIKELARKPCLLYDLANQAFKVQHYLPLPFLRFGARLLSPPRELFTEPLGVS